MTMYVYKNGVQTDRMNNLLNEFYTRFRNNDENSNIQIYKASMSAGTKSRARRLRRVNALLTFCQTGIQA